MRQHYNEFLTPNPKNDISFSRLIFKDLSKSSQDHVTDIMAERIVDHFEAVYVHSYNGESFTLVLQARENLNKASTICEIGQRIPIGLIVEYGQLLIDKADSCKKRPPETRSLQIPTIRFFDEKYALFFSKLFGSVSQLAQRATDSRRPPSCEKNPS